MPGRIRVELGGGSGRGGFPEAHPGRRTCIQSWRRPRTGNMNHRACFPGVASLKTNSLESRQESVQVGWAPVVRGGERQLTRAAVRRSCKMLREFNALKAIMLSNAPNGGLAWQRDSKAGSCSSPGPPAGIEGRMAELEGLQPEDFDRVMAVNMRGVSLWLSRLMKELKAQQAGVVTVVSSTDGLRGSIGMAPYVASKHAVLGLMKCAALEGAEAQVRVNAVNRSPSRAATKPVSPPEGPI